MLFTVLIMNYYLTSFAHVIPKLQQISSSGVDTINTEYQSIKQPQYEIYNFEESDPSLPPSPVQPRNNDPFNTLDTISGPSNQQQENEIANIRPPVDVVTTERSKRIEVIKQAILNGLHLREPPNATEPIRLLPPEILQSLADHQLKHHIQRHHHLEDDPDTTKVFVPADSTENIQCDFEENAQCFQFRFRPQSPDKRLVAVRLWIYLTADSNSSRDQRTIVASLPASRYGNRYSMPSKETYIQNGWIKIDFPQRRHVMKLFNDSLNFIEITNLPNSADMAPVDSRPSHRPILSLTYVLKNRARRQSNRRRCSANTNCCLRELALTFAEIGWDWIQPGSFRADYCTGNCPSNRPILTSSRTQLMTTFTSHQNVQLATPCCAPMSYGNLTVLYRDDDDILRQQTLPNIRALSCGCVV